MKKYITLKKMNLFFILIMFISLITSFSIQNNIFAEDEGKNYATETLSNNSIFTEINEDGQIKEISKTKLNESGIVEPSNNTSGLKMRAAVKTSDILVTKGVVNFRTKSSSSIKTTYTVDQTDQEGYTNGYYAADAAYLGHNEDRTKIKFMLSGVIGWVNASDVQVLDFSDSSVKTLSKYFVKDGRLYHGIVTNLNNSNYSSKIDCGPKPSYLVEGKEYYSYDGHYFYDYNNTNGYITMLNDYRNDTRQNSVNPSNPYYNYYQYLPHRSQSIYTAEQLNNALNILTATNSKMRNLGECLVENQNKYGINAMLVIGVAANESAWGTSSIAMNKNNLFGHAAYDSDPNGSANSYSSPAFSVYYHTSNYLSKQYCYPKYWKYNGSYLGDKASGMTVRYASDPYWGEKGASFAWITDKALGNKDQYKYTIGIKDIYNYSYHNSLIKKEASSSSTTLYETKTTANDILTNYSFIIINNQKINEFYKIQSDGPLDSSRNTLVNQSEYSFSDNYAYISNDNTIIINNGYSSSSDNSEINQPIYLTGDVDGDGLVEANDYMLIKLHVLGRKILSEDNLSRADIDKDGKIEANDYMLIKLHVLGRKKLF